VRARAFLVLAVLALTLGASALAHQNRELDEGIVSVALKGKVHARVILPAGYDDQPGRRYPVVYFLHGLPAGSTSYLGNSWLATAIPNGFDCSNKTLSGSVFGSQKPFGMTGREQRYRTRSLPKRRSIGSWSMRRAAIPA